jgi:hypothetical protein
MLSHGQHRESNGHARGAGQRCVSEAWNEVAEKMQCEEDGSGIGCHDGDPRWLWLGVGVI